MRHPHTINRNPHSGARPQQALQRPCHHCQVAPHAQPRPAAARSAMLFSRLTLLCHSSVHVRAEKS